MKEWIELLSVKPDTKDHSYRELMKELTKDACIWEDMHSTSSKIRQFHSLHIVYIKYKGIRFHIFEFGPQHCHPHNKSRTFFGKTHWTPNILKIKLHNSKAMLQWIKRWSTVSLVQRHIQHLLTIEKPILMRFSQVRVFSLATVHTKKETLWGALVIHKAFQGKGIEAKPRNFS